MWFSSSGFLSAENSINNQDPHSQIVYDETPEPGKPNETDSEEEETNKTSALPKFMQQILPNDEIVEGISSINSKQSEVFNVVQTWAKDYVKYYGCNVEQILMMIHEKEFAGLSVMIVANLLELPPVRQKLTFSQFCDRDSMKPLLGLQLYHLFKYAD